MVPKRQFLPGVTPSNGGMERSRGLRRNLTNILQMEELMAHRKLWREKGLRFLGILAVMLAGAAGCSVWENTPYLTDPKIQAGPPEAFVQPSYANYSRSRLAILPFRVPDQVTDVGYPITEVFHRQLLEKRPFRAAIRVSEYANNLAEARSLAKAQGAELFLLGEVPYFLDSGTTGKSGLQVDLRIIETSSGRTVWYLSDTISAEPAPIYDLWVTETKPKPSPSIYFLVETLAARMCTAMKTDLQAPTSQAYSGYSSPGSKEAAR